MNAAEYSLEEIDPTDHTTSASLDANGQFMLFTSFDDAAAMARFMVEDPTSFPLVAIIAGKVETDGEHVAWSAGYAVRAADGTVTVAEGDYENDPDWDALYALNTRDQAGTRQ